MPQSRWPVWNSKLWCRLRKCLTKDIFTGIIAFVCNGDLYYVKEGETLDSALRRFKRSCQKAGIQQEIRKREHYEKPSVRRKKKSEAARKRKYN